MANKKNRNNIKDERIEDVTEFGEFVSSFNQWITPERQRKVARHLEEITNVKSQESKGKDDKKRSN